ncbi:hypothetical protein R6Z07F_009567 [Ovis aries]
MVQEPVTRGPGVPTPLPPQHREPSVRTPQAAGAGKGEMKAEAKRNKGLRIWDPGRREGRQEDALRMLRISDCKRIQHSVMLTRLISLNHVDLNLWLPREKQRGETVATLRICDRHTA